ncbi:hypothetical protein D3C78_1807260 [compost metagenome]
MLDNQQCQLEHLGQVGAFGRQGQFKVGQRLAGLLGEQWRQLAVAVLPALAGDEQQAAVSAHFGNMGIGIATGVVQALWVAQLKCS